MRFRAKVFLFSVSLVALILYATTFVGGGPIQLESPRDWIGLLWFAAIALIAEAMAVNFRVGPSEQVRSSLAFLPFLSGLTLYPTPAAVLVIMVVSAVSQFGFRRSPPWRGVFNVSQGALSGMAAGTLFHLAINTGVFEVRNLYFALAFALTAATFFIVNMLLSSTALALLKDANVLHVFRQIIGPGGANLWYDLLASPIALVPVILYKDDPVTGVVVILLPLLLIQYSYLSKIDLLEANNGLLRALVKAIETRDPYTSGHSLRVATLARAIAGDLGIRGKKLTNVDVAALLHDIGKIDPIFAVVLSKPYDLTPDERILIQTHAARGADLLRSMRSVPDEVVGAVRHHHERYDGAGYPDGIRASDIPLIARIIMLCDSIDAMLSDRPYRDALPIEYVREEIQRCAGTQFDPSIVSVVIEKNTLDRAVQLIHADAKADALDQVSWA
jgi:putative nucleotidyltransferase with HDIG domain